MNRTHLIAGVAAAAVLAGACNRQVADENARRAAEEMRGAAAQAGDRLADGWLTTKIQAQYFADEDIKARHINVNARDGVVTLSGRVEDERAKEQALQIARNTDGVRDVRDQLAVGPAPAAEDEDAAWITTQIQARYFADSDLSGRDIDVATRDGVVTLSGLVNTPIEKEQAIAIAEGTDGVARVEDRLVVRLEGSEGAVATSGITVAPAGDALVTTSIQAKFYLDNALKSHRIEVETLRGVVTLRGEVSSDDERAQALLLARTTEGVERVEDALTVVAPPLSGAAAADEALATRIKASLAADTAISPRSGAAPVQVTAKDGIVLLEGALPTTAAKQRALTLARQTPGVVQVVDRITVR